jgi:hypothetical protein
MYRATLKDDLDRIDRRITDYRFDLEADVAWGSIGESGRYFQNDFIFDLGIDAPKLEKNREALAAFDWALALAISESFVFLEDEIIKFVEGNRDSLERSRSAELLLEEELKHTKLFERYGQELRARRPDLVEDFDAAFAATRDLYRVAVGRRMDSSRYRSEALRHLDVWGHIIFYEEWTLYVAERLAGAAVIQPAWASAHAAHRREEIQHVVTDVAYCKHLDVDPADRYAWSKMFALSVLGTVYVVADAPRDLVAKRFPELSPLENGIVASQSKFYADVLAHRCFRQTRSVAPYLAERAAQRRA